MDPRHVAIFCCGTMAAHAVQLTCHGAHPSPCNVYASCTTRQSRLVRRRSLVVHLLHTALCCQHHVTICNNTTADACRSKLWGTSGTSSSYKSHWGRRKAKPCDWFRARCGTPSPTTLQQRTTTMTVCIVCVSATDCTWSDDLCTAVGVRLRSEELALKYVLVRYTCFAIGVCKLVSRWSLQRRGASVVQLASSRPCPLVQDFRGKCIRA